LSFNGNLQPSSDEGTDLTTKGDIHGYSTENTRVGVGSDGQVLTARASNSNGIAWETGGGGSVSADQVVMPASTTIGDFSSGTSATASSAAGGADWTWDGTATGWTTVQDGGTANVDSTSAGKVYVSANSSNDVPRVSYDLNTALGGNAGNTWVLRFKVENTNFDNNAGGQAVAFDCGLASASDVGSSENAQATTDSIQLSMHAHGASSNCNGAIKSWNSTSDYTNTALVSTPLTLNGGTFYVQVTRLSVSSAKMEIFSDSGYSVAIAGWNATLASFTTNPSSLRYFFARIFYQGVSDTNTFEISDIELWNNTTSGGGQSASNVVDDDTATYWESNSEANPWVYVNLGSAKNCGNMAVYWKSTSTETQIKLQSSTNASAWTDLRTINVSDLTAGQYNYIRFNTKTAQYFRVYGNSGSTVVMAINEIKNTEFTDGAVATGHGHLDISSSDTSLALDGT
jgi:hypothetical protein